MTSDSGAKRPGTRMTGLGLVVAAVGAVLLIAGLVGSGSASVLSVLVIAAGLVIAAAGFARRVLSALENR